jgi:hypothetical protein
MRKSNEELLKKYTNPSSATSTQISKHIENNHGNNQDNQEM